MVKIIHFLFKHPVVNPQNTGGGCNQDAADSIACRSVCGKVRSVKLGVFVVYCLVNTWMKKKWGVYIKFFEKFEFRKKKFRQSRDENFEKSVFCKKFQSKSYFSMSNLNLECFQLSFDIHIAYVGKKWQIFKFFIPKGSKFSKSN